MTDTRATESTAPAPTPNAPSTSTASSDADGAEVEVKAPAPDRAAADRSTGQLTTADIARSGTEEREAAATEREARTHQSNMPEPKAAPLFSDDATNDLRERWTDVQAGFVDEPKTAVEQADALVAEVMKRLADSFATERQALEQQWSRGDDASTEDLRVALRRYRSFFDRLLSI